MVNLVCVGADQAELLTPLNHALIQEEGSATALSIEQLAQRMKAWLNADYQCWAVMEAQSYLGYCLFAEEAERIYVRQLYVLPEHRKEGWGRQLLQQVEAVTSTTKPLHLEVLAANSRVLDFYHRLGYQTYVYELRKER